MALLNTWRSACHNFNFQKYFFQQQFYSIYKGKPPGKARSLEKRLEDLRNSLGPETKINIGFPSLSLSRSQQLSERIDHVKKQRKDKQLEKLARQNELLVDLDEVDKDWANHNGPYHKKKIIEHYGIFKDLFNEGYFVPRVPLNIFYSLGDELCPVHYGNVIKPSEAVTAPEVTFDSDEESFWTLTLVNLDGHFTETGKEYIHWFVANIPGNEVRKGETIVEYLQPIPPRGTGHHRYVFVLYKHDKKINFNITPVDSTALLQERTFVTRDWYKRHQVAITPAGIAFFQSDWDTSLTDFFHNKLNMREPVFEYDFHRRHVSKQKWYPRKQPFNLYLDRHRDPKQINKEYLMRIMKTVDPFKKPDPPLKYPNAHLYIGLPSWLKTHEKKIRLKWGRINDIL